MALTLEDVEKQLAEQSAKLKQASEFMVNAKFPTIQSVEEMQAKVKSLQEKFDELHVRYAALNEPEMGEVHHCFWCP